MATAITNKAGTATWAIHNTEIGKDQEECCVGGVGTLQEKAIGVQNTDLVADI